MLIRSILVLAIALGGAGLRCFAQESEGSEGRPVRLSLTAQHEGQVDGSLSYYQVSVRPGQGYLISITNTSRDVDIYAYGSDPSFHVVRAQAEGPDLRKETVVASSDQAVLYFTVDGSYTKIGTRYQLTVTPAATDAALSGRQVAPGTTLQPTAADAALATRFGIDVAAFQQARQRNASESRLAAYRDSDEMLALKVAQLDYINASRRTNGGLPPVQLDILASRVANQMSQESAEDDFTGHWNMRGEKPYHRHAFSGGVDHVSENAAAYRSSGNWSSDPDEQLRLMRELHGLFMAEVSPNDGHRLNILTPEHNYVGLGLYLTGGQFRYYEEFLDRYIDFNSAPVQAAVAEEVTLDFTPRDGLFAFVVVANYEPHLKPLTPAEIEPRGSYADFSQDREILFAPWQLEQLKTEGRRYRLPLSFARPGLYYIHLYLDESEEGGRSTEGMIQASGIVVSVQ